MSDENLMEGPDPVESKGPQEVPKAPGMTEIPEPTDEEIKKALAAIAYLDENLTTDGAQFAFFAHEKMGTLAVKWLQQIIGQLVGNMIMADRMMIQHLLAEAVKAQQLKHQLDPKSPKLDPNTVVLLFRGLANLQRKTPPPCLNLQPAAEEPGKSQQNPVPPEGTGNSERPRSRLIIPG